MASIYIIYSDRCGRFLLPDYSRDEELLLQDFETDQPIKGFFGQTPPINYFDQLKEFLYKKGKAAIVHDSVGRSFLWRFLTAATLFLVIYVFFATVIKDPLPFIDEIALALIGAALIFRYIGKISRNSQKEADRNRRIIDKIDRTIFTPSPLLVGLEVLLRDIPADDSVKNSKNIFELRKKINLDCYEVKDEIKDFFQAVLTELKRESITVKDLQKFLSDTNQKKVNKNIRSILFGKKSRKPIFIVLYIALLVVDQCNLPKI